MKLELLYEEYLKDPGIKGSIDNLKHVLNQQQKASEIEIERISDLKMDDYSLRIKQLQIKSKYYKQLIDHLEIQVKKIEEEERMSDLESLLGLEVNIVNKLKKNGIKNIYSLLKTDEDFIKSKLTQKEIDEVFKQINKFIKDHKVKLSVGLELKDILEIDADTTKKLKNIGIFDIFSILIIEEEILIKELGESAIEIIYKAKKILKDVIIYGETIGEILGLDATTTTRLISLGITTVEAILERDNQYPLRAMLGKVKYIEVIQKAREYLAGQRPKPEIGLKIKDINLVGLTIVELTELCNRYDIPIKSGTNKPEIIDIVKTQLGDKEVSLE